MEASVCIEEMRKELHNLNNKIGVISACGSFIRSDEEIPEETRKYIRMMVEMAMTSGTVIQELYKLLSELRKINEQT